MANLIRLADNAGTNSTITRHCVRLYPYVNSGGVFDGKSPMQASLPRLEMQMFAVFIISHTLHSILKGFGIPILVSQILAGIILGSTGLATVIAQQRDYGRILFMIDSDEIIGNIGGIGFILSLFLSAVKMDLRLIAKTGKKSLYFGVLSSAIPALFGLPTMLMVSNHWNLDSKSKLALFYATLLHSVTSFAAICGFCSDLKIFNSELGRLGLSSASVSDILAVFFALCCFFRGNTIATNTYYGGRSVVLTIAFIIIVLIVVRPAMKWMIKQTPQGRPVKNLHIEIIIIGTLASCLITDFNGVYLIFGAIAFGLAVPTGPPLASALDEKLECLVSGIHLPLLVAMCSMRLDFSSINFDDNLMKSTAIIVAVIILAKFAGCLLPPLYCKLPKKDSLTFALMMSSKGILELFAYAYAREREGITDGMLSFLIVTILLTTAITSVLVSWLYDPSMKYTGYEKRNIMYSKELRILACISRPDNIKSTINFLQASCSPGVSPFVVDVLHLIKLSGRASPFFISHKIQKKTISDHSFSENVIRFFDRFQQINSGIVSINVFTAISLPTFMHEDICTLALDKRTSFMVLPFHKKWLVDGSSIESEDLTLRTLNCSILERAPCSVGILIDRGSLETNSWESLNGPTLLVAMIFLGGRNDREALVLAKRMAQNRNISLTIIHLVGPDADVEADSEKLLDSVALRNVANQHMKFVEVKVRDGLETTRIIRSTVNEYNFIVVGRRKDVKSTQTSGLDEFIEYPELGVVGSLVTSMYIPKRYSVLVVQQQISL